MFKVTVFKSKYPITKRAYYADDGEFEIERAVPFSKGEAFTIYHEDMMDFKDTLSKLNKYNALAYGTMGREQADVVPKKEFDLTNTKQITRTRTFFEYPEEPGILFLDYDPGKNPVLSRDELLEKIWSIIPGLADAPTLWRVSASSCIYDTDTNEEIVGIKSQHVYILIDDLRKSEHIVHKLHEGFSDIDRVTPQPERLDYISCICDEGLEKREPEIIVLNNDNPPFNTSEFSTKKEAEKKGELSVDTSIPTAERIAQILNGENFHDNIVNLTWGYSKEGMNRSTIIGTIKGIMNGCVNKDKRWTERYADIDRIVDGAIEQNLPDHIELPDIEEEEQFDHDSLEWPPGLMGELAKSAYKAQKLRNRSLAIVTAFASVAGIVGKRYNISGTGLNVYYTVIMESGSGKDQISKYRNRLYKEVGADGEAGHIAPRRFTGPKALTNVLLQKPCCISVFTEAGILFSSTSGDTAGLLRTILGLYTASGEHEQLDPEAYSDASDDVPTLDSVAFTIVNEATPTTLLKEFKRRESQATGELPRMFIYRLDGAMPYESFDDEFILSQSLKDRLVELVGECRNDMHGLPVKHIDRNLELYEPFSKYCTDQKRRYIETDPLRAAMHTRAGVKLMKHCALMAVMDGKNIITEEYFEWAKHAHEFEMKGLASLFNGVDSDISEAEAHLARGIVKLLSGTYRDRKLSVPYIMRSRGVFTRYHAEQATKSVPSIKELNDDPKFKTNPQKGVDKVLNSMCQLGYLRRLQEDDKLRGLTGCRAKVAYVITDEFQLLFGEGTKKKSPK